MAVIFENPGEIDPRMISTFGVNVKENNSAIGFFGTGLKYAIAILLRNNHRITIQAGTDVCEFGTQTDLLRGKEFSFVTMAIDGGDPWQLGFTTEVGKTWDMWMAYRELFCNCQDERGTVYEQAEHPEPEAGLTRVIVDGERFEEIRRDHNRYFLAGSPLWSNNDCAVHQGPGHGIFYRGVLVSCPGKGAHSRFRYNILSPIKLTEDRTAREPFMLDYAVSQALLKSDDTALVRQVVTAPDGTYENGLDFDWDHHKPSEAFLSVVGDLVRDRLVSVNQTAVKAYEKHAQVTSEPDRMSLTDVEQIMLDRALTFCKRIGFDITYQIVPVETAGPGILGMARNGLIYVTRAAFMGGTKQLAGTLIEEYVHLKHDVRDCSREMQEHLLNRLVSAGEQIIGEPL